eukprot:jgi/Mesvir1/11653/Mv00053-RA.1
MFLFGAKDTETMPVGLSLFSRSPFGGGAARHSSHSNGAAPDGEAQTDERLAPEGSRFSSESGGRLSLVGRARNTAGSTAHGLIRYGEFILGGLAMPLHHAVDAVLGTSRQRSLPKVGTDVDKLKLAWKENEVLKQEIDALRRSEAINRVTLEEAEHRLRTLAFELERANHSAVAELERTRHAAIADHNRLASEAATLARCLSEAEQQLAAATSCGLNAPHSDWNALNFEFSTSYENVFSAFSHYADRLMARIWETPDGPHILHVWLSEALHLPAGTGPGGELYDQRVLKLALIGLLSSVGFFAFETESFRGRGSSCLLPDRRQRASYFDRRYRALEQAAAHKEFWTRLTPEEARLFLVWYNDVYKRLKATVGHAPASNLLDAVFLGKGNQVELQTAAWSVWRLHALAYAFEAPPEIVWREAGEEADLGCTETDASWAVPLDGSLGSPVGNRGMQGRGRGLDIPSGGCLTPLIHEEGHAGGTCAGRLVAFSVFPGFLVGTSHMVSRCKLVLQTPGATHPQAQTLASPQRAPLASPPAQSPLPPRASPSPSPAAARQLWPEIQASQVPPMQTSHDFSTTQQQQPPVKTIAVARDLRSFDLSEAPSGSTRQFHMGPNVEVKKVAGPGGVPLQSGLVLEGGALGPFGVIPQPSTMEMPDGMKQAAGGQPAAHLPEGKMSWTSLWGPPYLDSGMNEAPVGASMD